ncbi:MAG: putative ABC transporter permease [Ruminococcus sp.]|nr:putative ABC transporter permease [Ruminococcus sp.]
MEPFNEKGFILFIFYSFLGWSWETIKCSAENRRFINRGFFKGPYCPIYGCGALIINEVLSNTDNTVMLFFGGAMLCTTLEYTTSLILEMLFHKRWWDYSSSRFNLKGRICLLCSTSFGVLSVLLIKFVQPLMDKLMASIPANCIHYIFMVSFLVYLADNLYTFYNMTGNIRKAFGYRLKNALNTSPFSTEMAVRISEKMFGGNEDE